MKVLQRAAILAVGSELLTPARVDTNSLFITRELNGLGIEVVLKMVTGDDRRELALAIRAALARADLVVVSGGLGPTDDDVTREAVAAELGLALEEDAAVAESLRLRFAARGFPGPMPAINLRQARVPDGARLLENTRGSAPGLWIDHTRGLVLLLPGPPRELEPMLRALIEGPLRERAGGTPIVRRILRIAGRIESHTDEALQPLYRAWEAASPPIAATILAALGQIELQLAVRASREEAARLLDEASRRVVEVLGADVFTTEGQKLEEVVGELLTAHDLEIVVAESCTGGLVSSRLTDVPGSSRYVRHGVVAYSNDAKTTLLGVPPDLIAAHGAVSEPVAVAMAQGARQAAVRRVGVGITGIAGPGGGSPGKPVGMVAIAVATEEELRSRVFRFLGEREPIKFQASQAALDMVRRVLVDA
jgi:nicotinamide-nucleotide amidase